jgi:hypothetical protein
VSVNGSDTPWTPRALEMLEQLAGLEENLTYREIAERMTAELGVTFTKNSCIGRGRRMGLPPRPPREHRAAPSLAPADAVSAPILPRIPKPKDGRLLTIYQLRRGVCHWPESELMERPPFLYCGKHTRLGNSFCPGHSRIAYGQPRRDR